MDAPTWKQRIEKELEIRWYAGPVWIWHQFLDESALLDAGTPPAGSFQRALWWIDRRTDDTN